MLPRELRQYGNRKIFFTLGAIILVALIATVTSLLALATLADVRGSSQTTSATINRLQNLLLQLRTAETAERTYLVTADPGSLANYHTATAAARADLSGIPGTDQLVALTQAHINLMDQTIAAAQAGTATSDSTATNLKSDQNQMDQISSAVTALSAPQTATLAAARTNITRLTNITRDISVATVALTLVLAGVVYYLYARAIQAERELDRAKDEFVSLASHQLRTPVTGIKAILSSLANGDFGPLESRQAYFIDKALTSSEHELAIIEELLDVAKADAGRLTLRPDRLDLAHLVTTIVAEQRPSIEQKKLTLKLQQPDKPIMASADRDKLYMAIGNILDNARKYTPASGIITIKTNTKRKTVSVEIADTGVGIDSADLDHIFERFGRAHTAPDSHIDGTGLGLYLAHHVTELHRGTLEVSSRKGHGSRFTLTIPIGGKS